MSRVFKLSIAVITLAAVTAVCFVDVLRSRHSRTGMQHQEMDLRPQNETLGCCGSRELKDPPLWWRANTYETVKNIRKIKGYLTTDQVSELQKFIWEASEVDGDESFGWIVDEIFIRLRQCQNEDAEIFLRDIVSTHREHVVRDYAIQHLASWAEETGNGVAVGTFLLKRISDRSEELEGSAIMSLLRLCREDLLSVTQEKAFNDYLRERVHSLPDNIVLATATIQAAAEQRIDVKDELARLALDPIRKQSVRVSAINGIATLTEGKHPVLTTIETSGVSRLQTVAASLRSQSNTNLNHE